MSLVIDSGIFPNLRSCIPYAADLNLAVRFNGENTPAVIDVAGNIYPAGIDVPSVGPIEVSQTVSTGLEIGFYGYAYVYAATGRYPYISNPAIGGFIGPRGNPSDNTIVNVVANNTTVKLRLQQSERQDLDTILIFRTDKFSSSADAQIAADGGAMFFVGSITTGVFGTGTVDFDDSQTAINISLGAIEFDNFFAPNARLAVYESPYFWAFANNPLVASVNWEDDLISLDESSPVGFYEGRDGQIANIVGITTGGFDGRGSYIWKTVTRTTGVLTLDGITPEVLTPATRSGFLTIQGPSTTLYRSKANNPFSWGETVVFGSVQQAQLFAIRVGGGKGTAIAVVPGGEILKIDTKFPARCYTYNLRIAGFPEFPQTRRQISTYSISSHFSQFIAVAANGNKCLWGLDSDSFAILQSDGLSQSIISNDVKEALRNIDTDPDRQGFCHGLSFDALELNCLWIPSKGRTYKESDPNLYQQIFNWTDLLICYHYHSGKWTTCLEFDLTCTTLINNNNLDRVAVLGGTATGIIGRLFADPTVEQPGSFGNFGYEVLGTIDASDFPEGNFNSVIFSDIFSSNLVGLWIEFYQFLNSLEDTRQIIYWARISSYDTDTGVANFDYLIRTGTLDSGVESEIAIAENVSNNIDYRCVLGNFPSSFFKYVKGYPVTKLDSIQAFWLVGQSLERTGVFIMNSDFITVINSTTEFLIENSGIWQAKNFTKEMSQLIPIQIQILEYNEDEIYPPYLRGIAIKWR